MPPRYFITHSWKDIEFARRLAGDMKARGLQGFFDDHSIGPGENIAARINKGLAECDIYLPILSRAALDSPWCEEEITTAITLSKRGGRKGRPLIIPLLIEKCEGQIEEKLPSLLVRLYISFIGRYAQALDELLSKGFGLSGAAPETRGRTLRAPMIKALQLQPRVLMIIYNPIVDSQSGLTLLEVLGWNEPNKLAQQFAQDIEECSHGAVQYQILERNTFVARVEVHEFPLKDQGTRLKPEEYLRMYQSGQFRGEMLDYGTVIREFNLLQRVAEDELDEVWLFGFPDAGFWSSVMAGKDAFFCNAEPLKDTARCPKRFVILGFNYERGVGEMLEDMGHRAESIMQRVYSDKSDAMNMFKRFTRYDQIAPGQANVGTLHFAPNSERDYDWANSRYVRSYCDDWLRYPYMPGVARKVNAAEWGGGDIRKHHMWWLSHLPHADGATDGIANNWWSYVIDPNNVPAGKDRSGPLGRVVRKTRPDSS